MNELPTLSVIGCGRLGKAITRLFHERKVFQIADVLNRSKESSNQAVQFVGAGNSIASFSDLSDTKLVFIAAADSSIELISDKLAQTKDFNSKIVFHASGALSYQVLDSLAKQGAFTASVHPMVTFSDPDRAAKAVPGSYCAMEGNPNALKILRNAFEKIGMHPFNLGNVSKSEYHASAVFVSNYVTTVIHTGIEQFVRTGLDRKHLLKALQPAITSIINSLFQEGTVQSLTGPISRGDANVIEGHLAALKEHAPEKLELYRQLALATVPISRSKGLATKESLDSIDNLLNSPEFKPNE